jgi:hypothetical protein
MNELLVPMDLKALVIGRTDAGAQWINLKPDFRGVYRRDQVLGQQLGAALEFGPSTSGLKPGVHLHWALPDGLTQGVAAKDESGAEFAAIPNRWLVVRFWDRNSAAPDLALDTRAWIVESDTVVTNDDSAAVWPTFATGKLDKADDYSVFVGKRYELSDWPGERAGERVIITPVGYGDVAFAAYYPACRGILGFHDQDLSGVAAGTNLHYLVVGWYADLADDPLARALKAAGSEQAFAQLEQFLGAKGWTYPGLADSREQMASIKAAQTDLQEARAKLTRLSGNGNASAIAELQRRIDAMEAKAGDFPRVLAQIQSQMPTRILCHGILAGVRYQDHVETGVPRGKPFRLALGETMVEALAALFERECGETVSKLLALFQYDLLSELEKPGGDAAVDSKIHERLCRPLARGKHWDVMQDARPAFGRGPEERQPSVPGDIRLLLEQVNSDQRRINELARQRDFLKSKLYAAWYKSVLKPASDESLRQELVDCQTALDRLSAGLAALAKPDAARPQSAECQQLRQSLETFLPGWKLQRLDEPTFWRPNDPVVLLAGEAFRRSPRHGEDGRFRADGQLLCRLAGQEITGIKVTLPSANLPDAEFGASDLDRWCDLVASLGSRPLPAPSTNLLREALLLTLDVKRARAIVVAIQEKNQLGLSVSRAQDIDPFARQLCEGYFTKIWNDARNPDLDSPSLRYPADTSAGQPVWELIGTLPSPVTLGRWEKNPWLPLFLQWQVRWVPAYSGIDKALEPWRFDTVDFAWQGDDGQAKQPAEVYRGTTLLTAGAAQQFSGRLRQYNLAHGDAGLAALQTAIGSMSLLCQSLGGFTDQLMMRKSYLELRPLDPGNQGPQFSPIFDAVKDIDWLSPLVDGAFFPLRSGYLTLDKLWVIDAFGQFLKLEEEGTPSGLKPLVPERLAAAGGAARLPPRLCQPARVSLQWLPAEDIPAAASGGQPAAEQAGPICGWIVPNLLDQGLMIYDTRGYARGALQANQCKSWSRGVGSTRAPIESFHWVDLPGSEHSYFGTPPQPQLDDRLGPDANAHLRAYVQGLLSLSEGSGQAFSSLLESMSDALGAGGGGANPNLALLVGKPLALVRAAIVLEVDGELAWAQGWDATTIQTGGIERLKFALRLGNWRKENDRWMGDDGLLGFFAGGDYSKFYPAWGLEGRNDRYNTYGFMPRIAIGETLEVTLVMDPSRGLCISSAILPRTRFQLPNRDVGEILDDKEIVFFSGPVLGAQDDQEMRMPQPSDVYGQWSWTHHPEVNVWREQSIADTQKDWGRFSDAPLRIRDGWLKLIATPLAIREFGILGRNPTIAEKQPQREGEAVVPARFQAQAGELIALSWSVIGAEEIALSAGDTLLFQSRRHPLPARYALRVEGDSAFTLTAVGRSVRDSAAPAQRSQRTIEIQVGAA